MSLDLYRQAGEAKEREMIAQAKTLEVERSAKIELAEKVEARTKELRRALEALESANSELALLSQPDGLTQLANRRYFDGVFDREFKMERLS